MARSKRAPPWAASVCEDFSPALVVRHQVALHVSLEESAQRVQGRGDSEFQTGGQVLGAGSQPVSGLVGCADKEIVRRTAPQIERAESRPGAVARGGPRHVRDDQDFALV